MHGFAFANSEKTASVGVRNVMGPQHYEEMGEKGNLMAAAQQPCTTAYQLWRQPCGCSVPVLVIALWLWCTSSSSSVAAVDQLFDSLRNQASTQRVGELRFITPAGSEEIDLQSLSPEEGFHKAFMGYVFRVQAWLVALE